LEKIGFLEKQLTIFREDMLKMSEKLIAKQEEIQRIRASISELMGENKQQKATIIDLFKRNKDLSVNAAH
jgi:DNA primase large subunit